VELVHFSSALTILILTGLCLSLFYGLLNCMSMFFNLFSYLPQVKNIKIGLYPGPAGDFTVLCDQLGLSLIMIL